MVRHSSSSVRAAALSLSLLASTALLGTASAQCPVDDDAGSNDACSAAAPIAPGLTSGLVVTSTSDDYWTFALAPGESALVEIIFSHAAGNLDLALSEAGGSCAVDALSWGLTDSESVTIENCGGAATYVARVFLTGTSTCNDYEFGLTVFPPAAPCGVADDVLEDNDSPSSATVLPVPTLQSNLLAACGDEDWYRLTVGVGKALTVAAVFDQSGGDIDLYLHDAVTSELLASSESRDDDERIVWQNLTAQTEDVLVRVELHGSGGCNDYEFEATELPATCALPDDPLEPNDSLISAIPLTTPPVGSLFVHSQAPDHFALQVPGNAILSVDLTFAHASGDLELRLFDATGILLDSSLGSGDLEQVTWINPSDSPTNVVMRVAVQFTSSQLCNSYTVDWSTAQPPCPTTDALEPNNDCGSAPLLAPGHYPGLIGEAADIDPDMFSIFVPSGYGARVTVSYASMDQPIHVALRGSCTGPAIDASTNFFVPPTRTVSGVNTSGQDQTWIVQAWKASSTPDSCAAYDLSLVVIPGNEVLQAYCFGDGSGTPCPCGNDSTPGHLGGCAHQSGNGTILVATGQPSAAADSLHFGLTSGPAGSVSLLVSGDNRLPQSGPCIGCGIALFDGLRCTGGNLLRHGLRAINALGATAVGWGAQHPPAGGLLAHGGFAVGQIRNFSAYVRTLPDAGCMTGWNTSNAVRVTFLP